MRAFLAAAFAAAVLLPAPALAESPSPPGAQAAPLVCRYSLELAVRDLAAQAVPKSIRTFHGADVQKILAAFNALEPVSDIKADTIIVLYHPFIPEVAILFGKNDCSVAIAAPWGVQKAEDLIAKALGTGI